MKRISLLSLLGTLLFGQFAFAADVCLECMSIRIGRPLIARGPSGTEMDNPFTMIQLPSGIRRGFTANQNTIAIDAIDPWGVYGNGTTVLSGSGNAPCGRWLFTADIYENAIVNATRGFLHREDGCQYPQTRKSMEYAESNDYGASWVVQGPFISSPEAEIAGAISGEGDCTVVNGGDSYYYAYCARYRKVPGTVNDVIEKTMVARVSRSNPARLAWKKYFNGAWNENGLLGDSSALDPSNVVNFQGSLGQGAARWITYDQTFIIGPDPYNTDKGIKISLASDKVTFRMLDEPLIPFDDNSWSRTPPPPTEWMAYPALMNYTNNTNQVSNQFLMTYSYVPPGRGFDKRFLVFRDVAVTMNASPVTPKVGLALSRWLSVDQKDYWSTTAPAVNPATTAFGVSYNYDKLLGYVMTKEPSASTPSIKLEDCVYNEENSASSWPGHTDHLLTNNGSCVSAGYKRLRTIGWIYQSAQPNTQPLYRCWNSQTMQHLVSNQADCELKGTMEYLLGYILVN
jgi:hypothetical protein